MELKYARSTFSREITGVQVGDAKFVHPDEVAALNRKIADLTRSLDASRQVASDATIARNAAQDELRQAKAVHAAAIATVKQSAERWESAAGAVTGQYLAAQVNHGAAITKLTKERDDARRLATTLDDANDRLCSTNAGHVQRIDRLDRAVVDLEQRNNSQAEMIRQKDLTIAPMRSTINKYAADLAIIKGQHAQQAATIYEDAAKIGKLTLERDKARGQIAELRRDAAHYHMYMGFAGGPLAQKAIEERDQARADYASAVERIIRLDRDLGTATQSMQQLATARDQAFKERDEARRVAGELNADLGALVATLNQFYVLDVKITPQVITLRPKENVIWRGAMLNTEIHRAKH